MTGQHLKLGYCATLCGKVGQSVGDQARCDLTSTTGSELYRLFYDLYWLSCAYLLAVINDVVGFIDLADNRPLPLECNGNELRFT